MDLPETILLEILARLPLTSIVRLKSACKEWKLFIESRFFRDLYRSLNRNSSSSWSVMHMDESPNGSYLLEVIAHQRPGITRSLVSYFSSFDRDFKIFQKVERLILLACTEGLILFRIKPFYRRREEGLYVCNPVLRQWIKVPSPPPSPPPLPPGNPWFSDFFPSGIVTHMENGVLLGYKVVQVATPYTTFGGFALQIYSSETGFWTSKYVNCSRPINRLVRYNPINLNGNLHWLDFSRCKGDPRAIIVHDFYVDGPEADQCRVIPLPDAAQDLDAYLYKPCFQRVCSTSGGFLMYINNVSKNEDHTLRVWTLKSYTGDSGEWELTFEINQAFIGFGLEYVPVTMHPFDTDVIYLWSVKEKCLLSGNLRTQKFKLHVESELRPDGGVQSFKDCREYIEFLYDICWDLFQELQYFSQFVLPQWPEPIPRPRSQADLPLNVLPKLA